VRHVSVRAVCPGEETVAAYVAGRLERDERDQFDSHLDTCSACHELLAALGKVGARHRDLAPPSTSLGRGSIDAEPGEAAASWAPGDQLGRYVLLARLGEGGMGVVYSAYDPELDRKVALKLLRHTGEHARAKLRDEARAIARLAHPNVVAVHDVGDAGGDLFVAMEHVDGVTLREWLRTPRAPAEIIAVFVQAGRGLAAAHEVGLVHRDVKPSNLVIGKDGRTRVLDFGLARARAGEDGVVGTPAYMPPEQQRGERVDARADQFAFCIALWEALAGARPVAAETGTLGGVADRVVRALRRGLAARPDERFATMDGLLRELAPPPRSGRRWVIATFVAGAALTTAVIALVSRGDGSPASCARAGDPIAAVWGDPQRAALRGAFDRTKLAYAGPAATSAIAQLDAWVARWQHSAETTCKATVIDRVQPPELHGVRQSCLDQLVERLSAIVALTTTADAVLVANAGGLAAGLPAPERCDDVSALIAVPAPAESARAEVASLRTVIASTEAAMIAGRLEQARPEIEALARRAETLGYLPLRARSLLLVARLELAASRTDQALSALHAGARAATAARDLEQLAEVWIELTQALGNDVATLEQADVFDGYAEALVALLPDRDALALQLEFARCNRNLSHTRANDAAILARHCQSTIEHAERARPPRTTVANAARTRLGHFQRLLGQPDAAKATLVAAVDEAVRVHGAQHPDTAVARYSLGIMELSQDRFEAGIAQLREALAIRRAAFPGNSLHVAESLQGLGDALASKGDQREAIELVEQALAMLEALGRSESLHAVNAHILLGMSLEEVDRNDEATVHYLRGADLADRAIQHREALAVVGLRLAADLAARSKRPAAGVAHLERALRLLERAKASPLELGKTQQRIGELLLELGPAERPRARAMAEAARASYVTAGSAGAAQLAALDKLLRERGWR